MCALLRVEQQFLGDLDFHNSFFDFWIQARRCPKFYIVHRNILILLSHTTFPQNTKKSAQQAVNFKAFLRDCAGVLTSVLGCVLCDFTQFLWFQCCWGGMLVFIGWLGGLWMYSGSNEISTVWVLWEYSGSTVSVLWEYCASTVPVLWEYCSSTVPVLCQ